MLYSDGCSAAATHLPVSMPVMHNKLDKMTVFIGSIAILALIFSGIFWNITFVSEGILGITAIIILWYTWETSQIRKAEREIAEVSRASLLKFYRPAAGCSVLTNKNKPFDTRISLLNLSDIAVAVKLHCNLTVDGESIKNFSPAYEGKDYWNLQFREEKEGHFSVLDLYFKRGLISKEEMQKIKEAGEPEDIRKQFYETFAFRHNEDGPSIGSSIPYEITMDLEIYCRNDKEQEAYYPPVHYKFDSFRMIWIPTLTSEKPYWDFDEKPDWI